MWVAAILAVGFHAVVLHLNIGEMYHRKRMMPETRQIILTLAVPPQPTVSDPPPPPSPVELKPAFSPKAERPQVPLSARKPEKKPQVRPKPRPVKPDLPPLPEMKPDPVGPPIETAESALPTTVEAAEMVPPNTPVSPMAATRDPAPAVREAEPPVREAFPIAEKNPRPFYPQQARKRGFQGLAILRVLVGTGGEVRDVQVHQSSGHEVLDRAAEETVRGWKFQPGYRGKEPVEMWIRIPIRFELN